MTYDLNTYGARRSFADKDRSPPREAYLYWRERTAIGEWQMDPRIPNDGNDQIPARNPAPDSPPHEENKPKIDEPRKEPPPLIVQ